MRWPFQSVPWRPSCMQGDCCVMKCPSNSSPSVCATSILLAKIQNNITSIRNTFLWTFKNGFVIYSCKCYAKIQNAERNYANFGSVCQQGPMKVKISAGQPCFWLKKADFNTNWCLIVNFNECAQSFLLYRQKSIIFILIHAGVDTFFSLGSSRTNTHCQTLVSELLFTQTKFRSANFGPFCMAGAKFVHVSTYLKQKSEVRLCNGVGWHLKRNREKTTEICLIESIRLVPFCVVLRKQFKYLWKSILAQPN